MRLVPMAIAFSLAFVSLPSAAAAQTHPPDIEARLAKVVGDWTIPGQENSYRETCAWYGKRAFVVCTSTDTSDGSMSQSILGFSKAKGRFTYHNYSGSGSSRSELGFPHGTSGIVYTDERDSADGLARVTTWVEPQTDGRLRFRQARSVKGGPWVQTVEFFYVPRK
jgi:hypothetical protein